MDNYSTPKSKFNKILRYFIQGLLFIAPLGITVYLIAWFFSFIDGLIPIGIPGLGIVIILASIVLMGYLSSTIVLKPLFAMGEEILMRTPLVSIIYTALKDLFSAFVSDEKKFKYPVLVTIDKTNNLKKLGFMTQRSLERFGLENDVAVYLPHSYNFSGNLLIVPRDSVVLLENMDSAETMKFIVSGGVTELPKEQRKPKESLMSSFAFMKMVRRHKDV